MEVELYPGHMYVGRNLILDTQTQDTFVLNEVGMFLKARYACVTPFCLFASITGCGLSWCRVQLKAGDCTACV